MNTFVSSVNTKGKNKTGDTFAVSLANKRHNNGPIMEPRSTPQHILLNSKYTLPNCANHFLPVK